MKVLGLLGGMSWESTIPYYRMINEQVKERLGGLHSAKIVLYSVDFQQVERLQHQATGKGPGNCWPPPPSRCAPPAPRRW